MKIARKAAVLYLVASFLIPPTISWAADSSGDKKLDDTLCCTFKDIHGIAWYGTRSQMTLDELAAYCGPILWFSPDEQLMNRQERGKGIRIPESYPFEADIDAPLLYYQVDNILVAGRGQAGAFTLDSTAKGNSIIDLQYIKGIDLKYFHYYASEAGLGEHPHDIESAEMKLAIVKNENCEDCPYAISIQKIIGKAHGLLWYDNHLEVDEYTRLPIGILVEEGKHASCPDKNLDGRYTPGYDVNQRVNDAWGVRDIISTGSLFSGGFNAWMNKTRLEQDKIYPPLPDDSPLRDQFTVNGAYAPDNAVYKIRIMPKKELAQPDERLVHLIERNSRPDWPRIRLDTDIKKLSDWIEEESFVKSLSIALRADGDLGISFIFPLFVVRNFEDPMGGGWLVNRIYLKDKDLRDFGWNIIYAPSASRWVDAYVSAGLEINYEDIPGTEGETTRETKFASEIGMKLRLNISHTPFKFMTRLTDFWGMRFGIKYYGEVTDFEKIGFLFEIGAGTW